MRITDFIYTMIKQIQSIKNLGVFQNWRKEGNLQDYNTKNIIYGWNYSGKTTLSRLFSFLEKKLIPIEFSGVEFEIKLEDNTSITQNDVLYNTLSVRVFNSDFIQDNLRFDSSDKKMTGITFDVGENTHFRAEIEKNNEFIEKARRKIENNSQNINKFKEFDLKYTNEARRIKNDCFNSVIEFNKGHLSRLIPEIIPNLDLFIKDDNTELTKIRTDSTSLDDKSVIAIDKPIVSYTSLLNKVLSLIQYEPQQAQSDSTLESNSDLYQWAKDGISLHSENNLNKCAFCGGDIHEERVIYLNTFFSNQAARLREKIIYLKDEIKKEKNIFEFLAWSTISSNDISTSLKNDFSLLLTEYKDIKADYLANLDALISILNKKLSESLFIKMAFPDADKASVDNLNSWINRVESTLLEHKSIIENFTQNQADAREAYKKHLVAVFLKNENYLEILRRKNVEEKYIQRYQSAIIKKEALNNEYRSKLKSILAGKNKINDFIKMFLNRDDILIDTTEDDFFVLKRGNKLANNLSEGEKTAIAFSHFMVTLDSLFLDGKLQDSVIFIDDPISSLDANHIAQVSSLINSFFFRKGLDADNPDKVIPCFKQLFISTHNFEFFSFLKDANNIKRKIKVIEPEGKTKEIPGCNYYFIRRMAVDVSTITLMPKYLSSYKSEYISLFAEIYYFHKDSCPEEKNTLMPNVIRRFLEIYTLIKLPGSTTEIDARIKELVSEVNELKVLHKFSHFTYHDGVTKHNELLLKLPELIDDIFSLLEKDEMHYKSLLEGINEKAIVVLP